MADKPQVNAGTPGSKGGSGVARAAKGCGCLVALAVLGFGILQIGGFDGASWASAVLGLLAAIGVFGMSGINGWWERD